MWLFTHLNVYGLMTGILFSLAVTVYQIAEVVKEHEKNEKQQRSSNRRDEGERRSMLG